MLCWLKATVLAQKWRCLSANAGNSIRLSKPLENDSAEWAWRSALCSARGECWAWPSRDCSWLGQNADKVRNCPLAVPEALNCLTFPAGSIWCCFQVDSARTELNYGTIILAGWCWRIDCCGKNLRIWSQKCECETKGKQRFFPRQICNQTTIWTQSFSSCLQASQGQRPCYNHYYTSRICLNASFYKYIMSSRQGSGTVQATENTGMSNTDNGPVHLELTC